jgi:hypothetical protein
MPMITYDNGHPLGPLSPDEQRWDVVLERLWGQVWPNIGRKPTRKCPARLPSSTRQVHHPGFPRCLLQGCLPRGGPASCFEAASNICFVSLPWGLPPPRTPGLGGLPPPDLGPPKERTRSFTTGQRPAKSLFQRGPREPDQAATGSPPKICPLPLSRSPNQKDL